jgi:hypothetical protein
MIIVRRATLDDKPAIFEFIKIAYQGRWQYKIPERWQWEYVDNPFLKGGELPVWVAIDEDGRVVGQTCALVEPLKIGERTYSLGWSVDTYLLKEYRGQGIGYQLQKANDEGNEVFMSLSMSHKNRRIKSGLGSIPIDPVTVYTRLSRYEPESIREAAAKRVVKKDSRLKKAVRGGLRWSQLDRLSAWLLNAWVDLKDLFYLRNSPSGVTINPVEFFTEEIDKLWERLSPCFYAIVKRDACFLNWKYVNQPHIEYERFVAWKDGELVGYVILRKGKPPERFLGIIADLFAAPDDGETIRALLSFAVVHLKRARIKDIVAATTVSAYQEALEKLGFRKAKVVYPMLHGKADAPELISALEPGSWFLGKSDHDWDQYPLAR